MLATIFLEAFAALGFMTFLFLLAVAGGVAVAYKMGLLPKLSEVIKKLKEKADG